MSYINLRFTYLLYLLTYLLHNLNVMDIQSVKSYVPTIHKSILLGTGVTWSNSRQVCMYFGSWTGGSCATFTTWQQFSAWNDILAAIWTYDVISKVGLLHEENRAKFHCDPT